jgi:hypothetical protein
MGLKGSRTAEQHLTPDEVVQLVADEMATAPDGKLGQNSLKVRIALKTGVHLKRSNNTLQTLKYY